jgi:hypothetical protein
MDRHAGDALSDWASTGNQKKGTLLFFGRQHIAGDAAEPMKAHVYDPDTDHIEGEGKLVHED